MVWGEVMWDLFGLRGGYGSYVVKSDVCVPSDGGAGVGVWVG